jgi:hypothetical protein
LDNWEESFEGSGKIAEKLETYRHDHPGKVDGICQQLLVLGQTISDVDGLEKNYGLKLNKKPDDHATPESVSEFRFLNSLSEENIRAFSQRLKANLGIIQSCRFVLGKHSQQWESLIDRIKESIDIIIEFTPNFELEIMIRKNFESIEKHLWRIEALEYEVKHSADKPAEAAHYKDLLQYMKFAEARKSDGIHRGQLFDRTAVSSVRHERFDNGPPPKLRCQRKPKRGTSVRAY